MTVTGTSVRKKLIEVALPLDAINDASRVSGEPVRPANSMESASLSGSNALSKARRAEAMLACSLAPNTPIITTISWAAAPPGS